jgi:ABC-type phosphate transport system substrate-binding protein
VDFTAHIPFLHRLRYLLAALLLTVSSAASPQSSALVADVIVSPSLTQLTLDRTLLRAVFTMRIRQWPDGTPVRVFVLPDDNPLSDQFYREHLGMYSYVLRRAWDRMVFTGTGFAPTVVRSEAEMFERVRSTPGAIGFVAKRESSSQNHPAPARWTIALLTVDAHE